MDLHISKKPDWKDVAPEDRNIFQNIASATDGWVTPANVLDCAGIALSISANIDIQRHKKTWAPFIKLALSRIIDVSDGKFADITQTKSPKGKFIDAIKDKVDIVPATIGYVDDGTIPKEVGLFVMASQSAIAIGALIAHLEKRDDIIQSGINGKRAMAHLSVGLGSYILSSALKKSESNHLAKFAHMGAELSMSFNKDRSIRAGSEYLKLLFDSFTK